MNIFKNLFEGKGLFCDNTVISLSSLRKKEEYVKITIPESYKRTYIPKYETNFLLY